MKVEQDMEAPIHMYYILHDFYQNHKRYVRSVSYNQLHGKEVSTKDLVECKPQRDLFGSGNSSFVDGGLIEPCGVIAWSNFNDSFTDFRVRRSPMLIVTRSFTACSRACTLCSRGGAALHMTALL
jgi:hypothetical protein